MPRQGLGQINVAAPENIVAIDDVLWEDFGGSGGEIAVNYQETRTNVVLHSQDTTDAEAWTKTNTAIDSTLYEAPDNSTTANAIKSNSTGEKSYNIIQSNLSVTAGKTYTASVHLKKDALGFAKLRFNDGTINYSATFNLTTGANVQAGNLIGTTNKTSTDTMDDGWFRCSMTFQAQNTTSSGFLRVSPQADASTANPNIAVSGIVLIYVWGFQLEESIEATSYIVTTTEARTRTTTLNDTSDVWDFDSANLMPEADPDSEGVWEVPANIVLNGDYEELGSEIINNGIFAGATISGDGSSFVSITQSGVFTNGKQYKVTVDVTINSGLGLKFQDGANNENIGFATTSGSYTFYFTAGSNASFIIGRRTGGTPFDSLINSVSIKQVDPNDRWSLGTSWSIEDGKLKNDGTNTGFQSAQQNNVTVVGDTYETTVTIEATSGAVELKGSGVYTRIDTLGVGTHTFTFVADSTNIRFTAAASATITLDNFTLREYAIQPQDV